MTAYSEHVDLQEGSGTGSIPVPRTSTALITEELPPTLAEVWPEVSVRLLRMVRRRVGCNH